MRLKKGMEKFMGRKKESNEERPVRIGRPAVTPRGRENQLINLAEQRAEEQLRAGTASSQVITHYLRLGAQREREELEQQLIRQKIETEKAKIDSFKSAKRIEDLYAKALSSMREYRGEEVSDNEEEE